MAPWQEPTTFAVTWSRAVATRPDAPFLIFERPDGTSASWTYGRFDAEVGRVAATLTEAGVGPGSSVHLALTNCPTFIAVWLASVRLGAWIVPSDPMGRTPELADHLERTAPVIGFCSSARSAEYRAAAPPSMTVVEIDETDTTFAPFPAEGFANWPLPSLTDRASVMFTSGTTGRPKGVEVTQANYAFAGKTMAEAAALTAEDRQFVVLPLFHANAQYYSFASAIWVGASVALMPHFSASGYLSQAARYDVTCASLFAAPMRMILARGGPVEGLSLRHCWFAQNLAADQYETLSSWFGCRPRQLYGMTETIPAVLSDEAGDPRPDMMGFVTDGCEVELHDGSGVVCEAGDVGEIVVRGVPGITLFAGYLDDPETTAAGFGDGWFLTGDRASRTDGGRFAFDGRRSDVLKVAGENVSTVEVESVLTAHPLVLEASVVGAPDPIRDEVPVAFVVAADPAAPPRSEELQRWCQDRLAKAKRPREITFLDELPRTSVGKIRKFLLAESATDSQSARDQVQTDVSPERGTDRIPIEPDCRHDKRGGGIAMSMFTSALLADLDTSTQDVAKAATLPAELYTSGEFLAFETEALFMKEWICVGRAERIPNVGDWFTVNVVGEPLIVARDKDGTVRAMSAVCQHRAMQVCEGQGNGTTFKCPYHHWNYGLDGRLLGAPAMERTESFNKADWGLPQLQVEEWLGFVFINFDADASPLTPTLERYTPYLENYDLPNAVCPGTFTLENLPWNWKVMFENFNDGYHANRLHQYVQDFCPSAMSSFPEPWSDDSNVIFRTAGYTHIDGGFNATHRVIMDVFPELTDEERTRSTFALVPPTLCFGTAPDQCFFFLVRPTGPETIDVEIGYIFHPSSLEDPLFEQKMALSDAGVQVFVEQDQDATTKVQRGLRSRFAPRGRYSWQEESHIQFNRWLVQRYRSAWPSEQHS